MNVAAPVVLYVFDSLKRICSYESRVCEGDYIGCAVYFLYILKIEPVNESFNHKCDYTGCVVYIWFSKNIIGS